MFESKNILITGGTGSFGNAMTRRLLKTSCKEIRIFSRDEKKQHDMRLRYRNSKIKFYIGDVRDYRRVSEVMKGVDLVFSAAALKQVPSCEFYPMEAVRTNIIGTDNVLLSARENNVRKVIVLSTDKAVYPINAMGMSKALMEKIAVARSHFLCDSQLEICVTRYGNVMATRGSVIPLFVKQIKEGKPLTITDPDMTRFMMSLEEAIKLVLFAFEKGVSGDTFIQKSPASTIKQLARVLKKIFNSSSEIRIIGTRHGEKKYETLLTSQESSRAIDLGGYYRIPSDVRDLNYDKYFEKGQAQKDYWEYTSENTYQLSDSELESMLLQLDCVREGRKE